MQAQPPGGSLEVGGRAEILHGADGVMLGVLDPQRFTDGLLALLAESIEGVDVPRARALAAEIVRPKLGFVALAKGSPQGIVGGVEHIAGAEGIEVHVPRLNVDVAVVVPAEAGIIVPVEPETPLSRAVPGPEHILRPVITEQIEQRNIVVEIQGVHVEDRRGLIQPPRLTIGGVIDRKHLSVYCPGRIQGRIRSSCNVRLIKEGLHLLPSCDSLRLGERVLIQIAELIVVAPIVAGQIVALEAHLGIRVVLDLNDDIVIIKDFLGVLVGAEVTEAEEHRFVRLYHIRADLDSFGGGVVEEHHAHSRFQTVADTRISDAGGTDGGLIAVIPFRAGPVDDVILRGDILLPAQELRGNADFRAVHGVARRDNRTVLERDTVGQLKVDVRACGTGVLHRGRALHLHGHRSRPFVLCSTGNIGMVDCSGYLVFLAEGHARGVDYDEMSVRVLGISLFQIDRTVAVVDVVAILTGKDLDTVFAVCDKVGLDLVLSQVAAIPAQEVDVDVRLVAAEGDTLGRTLRVTLVRRVLIEGEGARALPDVRKAVFAVLLDIDIQLCFLILTGAQGNGGLVAVQVGVVRLDLDADAAVHARDADRVFVRAVLDRIDDLQRETVAPGIAGEGLVVQRQPVACGDTNAANTVRIGHKAAVDFIEVRRKGEAVAVIAPSVKGTDRGGIDLHGKAGGNFLHARADRINGHAVRHRRTAAFDGQRVRACGDRAICPGVHGLIDGLGDLRHVIDQQLHLGGILGGIHHHVRNLLRGVLLQIPARPVGRDHDRARSPDLCDRSVQMVGFHCGAVHVHDAVDLDGVRTMREAGDRLGEASPGGGHGIGRIQNTVHIGVNGLGAGAGRRDIEAQIGRRILRHLVEVPFQREPLALDRELPACGAAVAVGQHKPHRVRADGQILEHVDRFIVALLYRDIRFEDAADIHGESARSGRRLRLGIDGEELIGDRSGACGVQHRE